MPSHNGRKAARPEGETLRLVSGAFDRLRLSGGRGPIPKAITPLNPPPLILSLSKDHTTNHLSRLRPVPKALSSMTAPEFTYPEGSAAFPHRSLVGIGGLAPHEIMFLLDEAQQWVELNRGTQKRRDLLSGLTIINAFFENSTRTLLSFEIAGKRLGADVVNMAVANSSVKKGETLIDTAWTLNAMRADAIVIRHASSGAVHLISNLVDCPVLNAGDGQHEHPTQALLDALTIRQNKRAFNGLRVTICGDILHSRVARSNILSLNSLGAEVRVCAPPALLPADIERMNVQVFHDFDAALKGANVVMMLRLQLERMEGQFIPSPREYRHLYGLSLERLAKAESNALVMHPGPMNRGIEIDSNVADLVGRSQITTQVEMGVAMRMACLEVLTRRARGVEGWA